MHKAFRGERGTWEASDRLCIGRYHTVSVSLVSKPEIQEHSEDCCDDQEANSTWDLR